MWIESPDQKELEELKSHLAELASRLEQGVEWPGQQLQLCADLGVFRWSVHSQWGGAEWTVADIMRGYLKLGAGCLTTAFIISQYTGAARRIGECNNLDLQASLLPKLARGEVFATLGISHLTTSRRHLKKPVLSATEVAGGYKLNGMAPWVTGATSADVVVVGASLDDGREMLAAVPTASSGLHVSSPVQLVALTASQTGTVEFDECFVGDKYLISGPVHDVTKQGVGAGTGGIQTSTLAIAVARAAVDYLREESSRREDLQKATSALTEEVESLEMDVIRTAAGEQVCSNEDLRSQANSLALRSAQSALSAAKGTGYVTGHPAGRWCREALFFLVWSCPQPVIAANLCELAGID